MDRKIFRSGPEKRLGAATSGGFLLPFEYSHGNQKILFFDRFENRYRDFEMAERSRAHLCADVSKKDLPAKATLSLREEMLNS